MIIQKRKTNKFLFTAKFLSDKYQIIFILKKIRLFWSFYSFSAFISVIANFSYIRVIIQFCFILLLSYETSTYK